MKTAEILFTTLLGMSSVASHAQTWRAELGQSSPAQAFSAIDHLNIEYVFEAKKDVNIQLRLENKHRHASTSTASENGSFVEGIVSYTIYPSLYAMTRMGLTDQKNLFVDQSLYQEFGWKAANIDGFSVDMNAGVGTRKFSSGSEKYINLGPTGSWAKGALWLRREQSIDGGGHRHVVAWKQYLSNDFSIDIGYIQEKRKKFTLPYLTQDGSDQMNAVRYQLGINKNFAHNINLQFKFEKVNLKKQGSDSSYYSPNIFSIAIEKRI